MSNQSTGRNPPIGLRRAAGYIRVSQVGGRGGDSFLSPDLQRERITAWAAYRGYTVVEWYVDLDVSGRTGVRRPEMERLMTDARAGSFEMVAVYRLTRFGRSVKDTASRYAELRDHNVGLVSCTEDIDSSTATGGLVQNMLFALAEFESERIGEEWSSVHSNRRARGLPNLPRGAYGYCTDGSTITGIDPAMAGVVEEVYRRRLAGESWTAISDALHRRGVPSPRGEPRWGHTSLLKLVRSPLYAGLLQHGDELVKGQHPAIIPRETWDQAQALHPRTARLARFGHGLASGLVVCAGCGYHMARSKTDRGRPVYRCPARIRSQRCPASTQIMADALDEYLDASVARSLKPGLMPNRGRVRRGTDKRGVLERRIEDANRAIDRLSDERFLIGSLSAEEYDRQLARLVERRSLAQAELDETAARPVAIDFDWDTLSTEAKQRVVRAVVTRVVVSRGRRPVAERVEIVWGGS